MRDPYAYGSRRLRKKIFTTEHARCILSILSVEALKL
jgi:hypothetical protein